MTKIMISILSLVPFANNLLMTHLFCPKNDEMHRAASTIQYLNTDDTYFQLIYAIRKSIFYWLKLSQDYTN